MVWIKRFVFLLLVLVFMVLAGAVFITWKYEDDLKNLALRTVRETITTDVQFNEDVKLSLWKDFPLVAIEFSNIRIQDSFKEDTLLEVEKAFIQFDVLRLLRNDVSIEGIRVTNGFLKLRRTAQNKWNYLVWKVPEKNEASKELNLSIEILTLENIHLDYDDRAIDLNIQFLSERSKIKGRFQDTKTRLGLSLNGFMENLSTIGDDRIVELPLNLKGVLDIDSENGVYTIETGNAILAGNEMVLNGEWRKLDSGTQMELKIHAGNIEPGTLLPHIWPQMPQSIKNLNLQGRSDVILTMSGPFTFNTGPELEATIRMRNGGILFQGKQVSDLNFEGMLHMKDIKRSKAMQLEFERFSLSTPSGTVSGSGQLTDLNAPYLKLKSKGTSALEELVDVAQISNRVMASGAIEWDIDFEGPLGTNFNTTLAELKKMSWSGSIGISDATLQFNSGIPALSSCNAEIALQNGNTIIRQCSGKLGHLEFDGSMEIAQLKEILTNATSPISLTGNVHLKQLNVEQLPAEWQFESETGTETEKRPLTITVNSTMDRIIYRDFTADNVSGNIVVQNDRVDISQLNLNALGGTINSSISYFPNELGYLLSIKGNLSNIDMKRTLAEWNNFGQESIRSENLKGYATVRLDAQIQLNSEQTILKEHLRVESDVEISGGELIDFEPLLAMSRFIDIDELTHVKFDTLRNRLSIKDSKLYIPKMSVSSSILNVDVFGEHGFDQEMDYHVNLLLNDIIRRKAKKRRTFDGHEIIDDKGKSRLFLWIRGTPDNIKVGFDKREVRKKIKDDLKKEGQVIKNIFQEEFGSGTNTKEESESEETIQFKLEDDGLENTEKSKPVEDENIGSEKPKKKKRGLFSSEPDKEETEGSFEIEFVP